MKTAIKSTALRDVQVSLDIEFGNKSGYFSGIKSGLYREASHMQLGRSSYAFTANLLDADLLVTDERYGWENRLERTLCAKPASDGATLYDFVSRYVVFSDDRPAFISKKKIQHKNSNIYYQYPADVAYVPCIGGGYLVFSDNGSLYPELFENVFYLRDERTLQTGERVWVVHHRLIAKRDLSELYVKVCNPRFSNATIRSPWVPFWFKGLTYRIRERKFPNFPIMTLGDVTIDSGAQVSLATSIKLCTAPDCKGS